MSPIMCLSSVLLPHPLPPMITNTSPRFTVKLRSFITTKSPKAIVRSFTMICGSPIAGATCALPLDVPAAGSDADDIEHHCEDSAGRDDGDDAADDGSRRRLA